VLVRRTRAHILDRAATLIAAPGVARLIATELGWNAAELDHQLGDYRRLVDQEQADAA
jgi:glycerol-3-phosphate dehydrogenase